LGAGLQDFLQERGRSIGKPDTYRPRTRRFDRRDCGAQSVGSTELAAWLVRYET
jgi:hypothetical protein